MGDRDKNTTSSTQGGVTRGDPDPSGHGNTPGGPPDVDVIGRPTLTQKGEQGELRQGGGEADNVQPSPPTRLPEERDTGGWNAKPPTRSKCGPGGGYSSDLCSGTRKTSTEERQAMLRKSAMGNG